MKAVKSGKVGKLKVEGRNGSFLTGFNKMNRTHSRESNFVGTK